MHSKHWYYYRRCKTKWLLSFCHPSPAPSAVVVDTMVDRVVAMLNYFLTKLIGPERNAIKVRKERKERGREGGREEERKGGRKGGREERRKGGREKRREEERKGGREEGRKGGREEGRKGGKEEGCTVCLSRSQ